MLVSSGGAGVEEPSMKTKMSSDSIYATVYTVLHPPITYCNRLNALLHGRFTYALILLLTVQASTTRSTLCCCESLPEV